jgi:hypothetical protein
VSWGGIVAFYHENLEIPEIPEIQEMIIFLHFPDFAIGNSSYSIFMFLLQLDGYLICDVHKFWRKKRHLLNEKRMLYYNCSLIITFNS